MIELFFDCSSHRTPTIFVDKTDMCFGNDCLPLVREALQRRKASAA
jgi:hypothetical protein